jgi:hypothetical protein
MKTKRHCPWLIGRSLSEETKLKICLANTGKIRTEEAKEKMRLAKKDYIARNKGKSPIFYQFILL